MFLALASIFFIAVLAFVAIAPQQVIQIFLAFTWFGMGLSVVYTILAGIFS
ncbi:hypothetical protein SAMN05216420_102130 [Nitrosospira sp. Nl5]|nr:hypothetical protein SAMN05216420_102130 [Nitrosospira sp. Nl5]